jgi:4-aminobutyrate aminotransferase-like enzyme
LSETPSAYSKSPHPREALQDKGGTRGQVNAPPEGKGGLFGQAIRLKPPMCWTEADADFCLRCFEESVAEVLGARI